MARKRKNPGLAVVCHRCHAPAGQQCITSGGKELLATHEPRKQVSAALNRLNSGGLRGKFPGQYLIKDLVVVERNELDPKVTDEKLIDSRVRGRPVVEHYIVETVVGDEGLVEHTIERDGDRWEIVRQVADTLQRHRLKVEASRKADAEALRILSRYGGEGL